MIFEGCTVGCIIVSQVVFLGYFRRGGNSPNSSNTHQVLKSFPITVDSDECDMATSSCSQTCTNAHGSYVCGCEPGYSLDEDGVTCHIGIMTSARSSNIAHEPPSLQP